MEKMLQKIDGAIKEKYEQLKKNGGIMTGIEEVHRQIRFGNRDLAEHIRKRMIELAKENGDLP